MKTHKIIMVALAALGVILIIFGPALNVSRSFGILLLICPLMMLAMMGNMGDNHKH